MWVRKFFIAGFITFSFLFTSCAQDNIHSSIRSIAITLMNNLKRSDTSAILAMYDSVFAKTDKPNYRAYIKESIIHDAQIFKHVFERHGMPKMSEFIFSKDSRTEANVLTIGLLEAPDSILNLKKCDLVVIFYPDIYFKKGANKFLRFFIDNSFVVSKTDDKVKMPPPMHNR